MNVDRRFIVRRWSDGSVIFDRHLGDTHALDPTATDIFLSIQSGETSSSLLIEATSSHYPESTMDELVSKVDRTISHLKKIGLLGECFH